MSGSTSRPAWHCCLLDASCWRDWWQCGAPLRLYLGHRFWTVLSGDRRARRVWDPKNDVETSPVETERRET